jgi:hypothetical protein
MRNTLPSNTKPKKKKEKKTNDGTLLEQIVRMFLGEDSDAAQQAKDANYIHIVGSQGMWSQNGEWPAEATTQGGEFKVLDEPVDKGDKKKKDGATTPADDTDDDAGEDGEDDTGDDDKEDAATKRVKAVVGGTPEKAEAHSESNKEFAFQTEQDREERIRRFKERRDAVLSVVDQLKKKTLEKIKPKKISTVKMFNDGHVELDKSYTLPDPPGGTMTGEEMKEVLDTKAAAGQEQSLMSEAATTYGVGLVATISKEYPKANADEMAKLVIERIIEERPDDGLSDASWQNATEGQILATLRQLEAMGYSSSDVAFTTWDDGDGNRLAGTTGHSTSSDFFITMTDGTTLGVSLKKDGEIIFANLGAKKWITETLDSLPDDGPHRELGGLVDREFASAESTLSTEEMASSVDKVGEAVCKDKEKANTVFGKNHATYCATRESIVAKLKAGPPPKLTGNERKFVSRLIANSGDDSFDEVKSLYRDIDTTLTQTLISAASGSEGEPLRQHLAETVVSGLHTVEHLGLVRDPRPPNPDRLVTAFGTGTHVGEEEVYKMYKLNPDERRQVEEMVAEANKKEGSERGAAIDDVERWFAERITVEPSDKGFVANLNVDRDDDEPVKVGEVIVRTKGLGSQPNLLIQPVDDVREMVKGEATSAKIGKTRTRAVQKVLGESKTEAIRPLLRSLIVRELDRIRNGN